MRLAETKQYGWRRLVSCALVCTCIFQLFTFVVFADDGEDVLKDPGGNASWTTYMASGGRKSLTKDAAANQFSTYISTAKGEFDSAMNSGSVPAAMLAYGKSLISMDWLCSNAYRFPLFQVDESAALSEANWYTAFEGYQVDSGLDTLGEQIGIVVDEYTKLSEQREKLPSGALSVEITPVTSQLQGDSNQAFLGSKLYKDALQDLVVNYVEYNVLKIIAEDNGLTVSDTDTSESIASAIESANIFPAGYMDKVDAHEYEEVRTVLNQGSDPEKPTMKKIGVYLDIIEKLSSECSTVNNFVGVRTQVANPNNPEYTFDYNPVSIIAGSPMVSSMLTDITKACWYAHSATDSSENSSTDTVGTTMSEVDLSNGIGKALANIKIDKNGAVIDDGSDTLKLTDLGWCVLAAGCVYEPFVSKAGDVNFVETVNKFVGDDKKEDLSKVLRQALNTRKPLYYSENASNAWWGKLEIEEIDVGTASPATLATMFHEDSSVQRAYFMFKGTMQATIDSSTYEYVQSTNNTDPTTQAGNTAEAEGGSENDLKTVGGDNVTITKEQVTRPIAFTTGRQAAIGNNAGKGFYSGLGGLTELILVNAKQDCKDNEHFKTPETEFLFVDGLGDIVLADGTIVLPAIANPALWNYTDDSKISTTNTERGILGILSSNLDDNVIHGLGGVGEIVDNVTDFLDILDLKTKWKDISELVGLGKKKVDVEGETVEEGSTETKEIETELNYYPYNVAFSNHYPRLRLGAENATVTATGKTDKGKMILNQSATITTVVPIEDIKGNGTVVAPKGNEIKAMPIQGPCFAPGSDENDVIGMYTMGFATRSGESGWHLWNNMETTFVAPSFKMSTAGQPFFPLLLDNADMLESYLNVSGPIVTSCIRYLTTGDDSIGRSDAGTANIELWIFDMVGQAMLGNSYSEQMVKNLKLDYQSIVDDQYNRFMLGVRDLVSDVFNSLGHIDGVLAMKDGYSSNVFNGIMSFIQTFYVILVVMLLMLVAVKFLRGRYSFLFVAFLGLFTAAAFQVYAVWMPTAVPAMYNLFVNDIVEDITWSAVTVKAEQYDETYKDANRVDAMTGEPRPYTATITLYKMTQGEMEDVAAHTGTDIKQIRAGKPVWLDRDAGIFAQGDTIKMSIDTLLANNTMRGLYQTQWAEIAVTTETTEGSEVAPVDVQADGNPYIIKLTNPYVSMESYYTPFCQFERSFMVNLNNFANIFRIQRASYSYGDGVFKDAFLFNSFTNSGIFLDPNSETTNDTLMQNVNVEDITGDYMPDVQDIITQCHVYMDPFEDWLNLRSVFSHPSQAMQESLWGRMMLRQGYYGPGWEMDEYQEEKVSKLIYYINNMTKQFVVRNQDQLNFCSDENAIKLVTLYATTCFTHEVSQFGYWLYPNYINSSDLELRDVLYGAMTSIKDRNVALNSDMVNVVMMHLGLPGLLMLFLILIFSVVFIFVITYLIPILYAMFGALLLFKLGGADSNLGVIKGYIKVTGVTVVLYCVFSFGLRVVKWGGYQWYGYLACVIISALCVYFLGYVVFSVVKNPLELGNDVLMSNLFGALDKLTGHRLSRLTTNKIQVNANRGYNIGGPSWGSRHFLRHSGIDRSLPGSFGRRRGYYGRYGSMNDYSYDSRRYRSSMFGNRGFGLGRRGGYGSGFGTRFNYGRRRNYNSSYGGYSDYGSNSWDYDRY